jgi:hypothetical protein
MSGDSGIRGLLPVANDRQREGAQHRRIGRGVFRPRDGLGRRARESFVEVQSDLRMARAREERIGEALLRVGLKQRVRQPERFVSIPEDAGLAGGSLPPA